MIGTLPTLSGAQPLKSQRFIEHDDIETDLNVPKSMQEFIYKKMSQKIADSIQFVDVKKNKQEMEMHQKAGCVRLLRNMDPITSIGDELQESTNSGKRKTFRVKRRLVEPDEYNFDEKMKLASIDGESILQQLDTKSYPNKIKANKVFNYREKKSTLHYIEPDNEFSKLRRKNKWNESKIANFTRKINHNQF